MRSHLRSFTDVANFFKDKDDEMYKAALKNLIAMALSTVKEKGLSTALGDEGGFAPNLKNNAEAIEVKESSVVVKRQYDDRYHIVKAKMPCLVTALAELNEPRYMTPGGIFDAYKKDITVWGRKDLKDVEDSNLGLKGSPTQIAKASDKVRKGAGEKVVLDPTASVDYIVGKLTEKHVL